MTNSPAFGHFNYQLLFFLFMCVKEGNAFGVLTLKHEDHHQPICSWTLWHEDTPLALEAFLPLSF